MTVVEGHSFIDTQIPPLPNSYQAYTWVSWRDAGLATLTDTWEKLFHLNLYHADPIAGSSESLKNALEKGLLPVMGVSSDGTHKELSPLYWTSRRLCPMEPNELAPYVSYRVNCVDLLRLFPSLEARPVITLAVESECEAWLLAAFEADPHGERSKLSFQRQAISQFGGRLSRRGFIRVWDQVARANGRSLPGPKPKR